MTLVQVQNVTYKQYETQFKSVLCEPEGDEKYPAVITIHGIYGLQEMDVRFASRLSSEGYVVLVHGWQSKELDPPDQDIIRGVESALSFLRMNKKVDLVQVGLIGVCRGGSIAMITGSFIDQFKALVSFYGQSYYPVLSKKKPHSPIELIDRIQSEILVIHGEEDSIFSYQESIDYCNALKEQGKSFQCRFYPGADHGFFLEGHRNYHRQASEDAWVVLKKFLAKSLRKDELK